MYIIKDWTGRTLFEGSKFETFEDAWDFIYERDPQPEEGVDVANWYSDYEVEQE